MTSFNREGAPEPDDELFPEPEEPLNPAILLEGNGEESLLDDGVAVVLRPEPAEPEPQFGDAQLDATRMYLSESAIRRCLPPRKRSITAAAP